MSDRFTVETGVCERHPHYPDTNTFDNRYVCDCPPNDVQKAWAMYAAFTGPTASDAGLRALEQHLADDQRMSSLNGDDRRLNKDWVEGRASMLGKYATLVKAALNAPAAVCDHGSIFAIAEVTNRPHLSIFWCRKCGAWRTEDSDKWMQPDKFEAAGGKNA